MRIISSILFIFLLCPFIGTESTYSAGGGGETSGSNTTTVGKLPDSFEGNVITGFVFAVIFLYFLFSIPMCCLCCWCLQSGRNVAKKRPRYWEAIRGIFGGETEEVKAARKKYYEDQKKKEEENEERGESESDASEEPFEKKSSFFSHLIKPADLYCDKNMVSFLEVISGWISVMLVAYLTVHSVYFVSYIYGDAVRMRYITGQTVWFQDWSGDKDAEKIYLSAAGRVHRNLISATYSINYTTFGFGLTFMVFFVSCWFVLICFLPGHHHHHHHGQQGVPGVQIIPKADGSLDASQGEGTRSEGETESESTATADFQEGSTGNEKEIVNNNEGKDGHVKIDKNLDKDDEIKTISSPSSPSTFGEGEQS